MTLWAQKVWPDGMRCDAMSSLEGGCDHARREPECDVRYCQSFASVPSRKECRHTRKAVSFSGKKRNFPFAGEIRRYMWEISGGKQDDGF